MKFKAVISFANIIRVIGCLNLVVYTLTNTALAFANESQKTQDEQPKKTLASTKKSIDFIGVDDELLANIKLYVRLASRLEAGDSLSPDELRRLRKRVVEETQKALEPFGYYNVTVVNEATSSETQLFYKVTLNQPVIIESIDLTLTDQAKQQKEFTDWVAKYPLSKGQKLDQAKYENAKKALLASALNLGYFDASLDESQIIINQPRTQARIVHVFESGARYSIGNINITWQDNGSPLKERDQIERDILDTFINIKSGSKFINKSLLETQQNLLATPYFSNVDVQPGKANKLSSLVDINIFLTPRKQKAYSLELGAGSDTGVRGGVAYDNYRINSKGHNLSTRLGGSAIKNSVNVNYRIPLAREATDNLGFFASLEKENGEAREFTTNQIGSELSLAWGEAFLKFGISVSRESSTSINDDLLEIDEQVDLLIPSFIWQQTKSDDLINPTKGWSAQAEFRVANQALISDIDLAQALVNINTLHPFGQGRLKLRLKFGTTVIDDPEDIPDSLGFLAGGNDSIRGYRFENIGVERNGKTNVAKNIVVGSIEYQHPIRNSLSLAAFYDIGDAFDDNPDFRAGAGVGLRWRLPFGALKLDLASGLDLEGNPLRLHFSFGTDL